MTEDASMKDKATESAQAGKEAASNVASTAVDKAQDVAQVAQGQARNLVGEARGQLRSQANQQAQTAVTNLRALGDELRSMANNGQQEGQQSGIASELVSQAADRTHGVADWLDGRNPEDLLDEVRRFARRRPGAFLVGALAAGVVAGRLTRGVVAEHTDSDSGDSGRHATPGALSGPTPGYATTQYSTPQHYSTPPVTPTPGAPLPGVPTSTDTLGQPGALR